MTTEQRVFASAGPKIMKNLGDSTAQNRKIFLAAGPAITQKLGDTTAQNRKIFAAAGLPYPPPKKP